ncbi:hypothetical protein DFH06DRAFT_1334856 [Mycena polygramma]|nr:hypothetical protein DFH06DRAFT_1334856 [Mycena polygramma]
MPSLDRSTVFRIISLSLAAGDVFQTIPGTITLYRKQWRRRRLSALCFFYAMARYISILSLAANGYDAFSTNYTPETCRTWYMLPNVTALLAGMAVQVVVYIRTIAISGRSKYVRFGMGMVMLMGFPVQIFGIVYHRDVCFLVYSFIDETNWCFFSHILTTDRALPSRRWFQILKHALDVKEESFGQASAHMVFDLIAFVTATYYLVYASWVQGIFHFPKFTSHIIRDGLLYFLVVFLVNLWVVLEFAYVFTSGARSSLPLAVVLIAIQHWS